MRFTTRWMTWLCLSLMLWTALAESTHSHPNKTEQAPCSICVVAHSTTPTAISSHAKPVFAAVGMPQEEEVIAPSPLDAFELGIRGPPPVL